MRALQGALGVGTFNCGQGYTEENWKLYLTGRHDPKLVEHCEWDELRP
jgi:hypothetical protein